MWVFVCVYVRMCVCVFMCLCEGVCVCILCIFNQFNIYSFKQLNFHEHSGVFVSTRIISLPHSG